MSFSAINWKKLISFFCPALSRVLSLRAVHHRKENSRYCKRNYCNKNQDYFKQFILKSVKSSNTDNSIRTTLHTTLKMRNPILLLNMLQRIYICSTCFFLPHWVRFPYHACYITACPVYAWLNLFTRLSNIRRRLIWAPVASQWLREPDQK